MLHVFAVFDDAAKAYLQPFYCPSRGMALRGFMDGIGDPNSNLSRHSADFTLFHLGTFDESSAKFNLLAAPERVANALELKETAAPRAA